MTEFRKLIHARRRALEDKLKEIQAELDEIEKAEEALGGKHAFASVSISAAASVTAKGERGAGTIKEMVLEVLRDNPEGLDAHEIIDAVKRIYDVDVPRSSMSPQLSRLKSEGKLDLNKRTKIWTIKNEDPAEAGPSPVGDVAERSIAPDSKSGEPDPSKDNTGSGGSNPSISAHSEGSSDFFEPSGENSSSPQSSTLKPEAGE